MRRTLPILACISFGLAAATAGAAPGQLDPTFGPGGNVTLTFPGDQPVKITASHALFDGRIVVAGTVPGRIPGYQRVVFGRFNQGGTLDPAFGSGGWVLHGDDLTCEPSALTVTPSGHTLIACAYPDGSGSSGYKVLRHLPDTTRDWGWPEPSNSSVRPSALVAQADGGFLVVGTGGFSPRYGSIIKFSATGSQDYYYGYGGETQIHAGAHLDFAAAKEHNGWLYLAGSFGDGGYTSDVVLTRVSSTGTHDANFYSQTDFGQHEVVTSLAIDANGRFILGGANRSMDGNAEVKLFVARLLDTGQRDWSFAALQGTPGKVTTDVTYSNYDEASVVSLAVVGNEIIAAGRSKVVGSSQSDVVLWRVMESGEPDPAYSDCVLAPCGVRHIAASEDDLVIGASLQGAPSAVMTVGTRGGAEAFATLHSLSSGAQSSVVTAHPIIPPDSYVNDVAVQPDGKLLVVGYGAGATQRISRLNTDGTIDTSFGTNGFANSPPAEVMKVALDGTIYLAAGASAVVNRVSPTGVTDTSGSWGTIAIGGNAIRDLAVLPDGGALVLITLATWGNGYSSQSRVGKFAPDGSRALSFGTNGVVDLPVAANVAEDPGAALAVQPDGKILVASGLRLLPYFPLRYVVQVVRLNVDGSIDTSWGTNGRATLDTGNVFFPNALAIAADGKVVAAGSCMPDGNTPDVCVGRFLTTGQVDTLFGVNGVARHDLYPAWSNPNGYNIGHDRGYTLGIDPQGRMLVGATIGYDFKATVARLLPDGALDASFDGDGQSVGVDAGPQAGVMTASGDFFFGVGTPGQWTLTKIQGGGTIPAPDTTITAGPGATSGTSATFSFASNPAGAGFECRLDTQAYSSCTSPKTYTPLTAGAHTFFVRAVQGGNADPTPASFTWSVDAAAPDTTLSGAPTGTTSSTSATLAFTSEAGATFECKLDAAAFAACTSPLPLTGLAEGSHTFQVRARDAQGNVDETPASATWTVDTTAPDTTLWVFPSGTTAQTSTSISFYAEAGSTFECKLDAAAFAACTSPVALSGLAEGAHTFQVRAKDVAGNTDATPAQASWTVDTTPPDTSLSGAPTGTVTTTSATLSFSSEAGATFECKLDSASFSNCTSPVTLSNLADGPHTFQVRARDVALNTDPTPAQATWTVDGTAPETSITSGPSGLVAVTTASIAFTAEAGATFECSLDGAAFSACTSPASLSSLAQGAHEFRVRARDAAGNADATPASRSWSVDSVAPDVLVTKAPYAITSLPFSNFEFTSSEGAVTFTCKLDSAAPAPCTSPFSGGPVAAGSHTFTVTATDAAGNATAATRNWTVDPNYVPQTFLDSGPSGPVGQSTVTFAFHSDRPGSTFECLVGSGVFTPCPSNPYTVTLPDGNHSFHVLAIDAEGNRDVSAASTFFSIDTVAPVVSLTSMPPAQSNSTSASFTISTNEGTLQCRLDNGAYVTCASPAAYSGLAQGVHTFYVKAADAAGNVSQIVVYSWTIDTLAPDTTLTGGPSGGNNTNPVAFTFTASEAGSTFECSMDNAAFAACVSGVSYSGLAKGQHTFQVRARDAAGNVDVSPASRQFGVK